MTARALLHPHPVLKFVFAMSGLAWTCSTCGKLFAICLEEAVKRESLELPEPLRLEFRQHHCGVVLSHKFEVVQLESTAKRQAPALGRD